MNKNELAVKQGPTLGREIQTKIAEQLGVMYDEIVRQGVPERFEELLKRLADKDGTDRS